jgi:hypothetical protein
MYKENIMALNIENAAVKIVRASLDYYESEDSASACILAHFVPLTCSHTEAEYAY